MQPLSQRHFWSYRDLPPQGSSLCSSPPITAPSQCVVGFPGGASDKPPACQCKKHKRLQFDPWVRKIPGEGNGNPLQYSCLEDPMDRGAWRAIVHGVAESDTNETT